MVDAPELKPSSTIPPRPPTPGLGPTPETSRAGWRGSRSFKVASTAWAWRRLIIAGAGASYGLVKWQQAKRLVAERDAIHDKTILYWKLYDGGIVEAKSYGADLNYVLNSSQGSPEEPPRVMNLFDVIRAIKLIENDDRIHGIIADFSQLSAPSVPSYSLGLAQVEEIQDALIQLRQHKHAALGKEKWRSVAWSDTWHSQGQYLFASNFDEVYTQPTGEVPLVGMGSTLTFYGRLAKWLGVDVHAEARNEYKSFVQPYIDEALTQPQRENHEKLLNDLNDNLLTYIARNRFPDKHGQQGLDKVKLMSQTGPYTARQAVENGLLTGTCYRQDVIDSFTKSEHGGDDERKIKGFYHYHKVMERAIEKAKHTMEIGVVYLLGPIGEPGEFGTAAVVRGLKEAGADPEIGAVVLRVDSGGGGVVESDTIWGAVRDLREKDGKIVVASFGNASASGGYLVSTHTDAILAAPSTITGSIGVASLRPTFLTKFFDRFHVTLESIFTGSRAHDLTHSLDPDELKRHAAAVDEMYDDFKNRVCAGRDISPDVIENIAGGRVMTGLSAFAIHAPAELVRGIKGLDAVEEAVVAEAGKITEIKEETKETESSSVAVIAEDQVTSPFAPPQPKQVLATAPHAEQPAVGPAPVETAAAKATEGEEKKKGVIAQTAPGIYAFTPGKYGRGLVDGLGGIRDAAVYACELFLSNGIAGYTQENPGMTQSEAVKALLPESNFSVGDSGELMLEMDVKLKRFPVHKSLWGLLKDSANRGDSMEAVASLPAFLKAKAGQWLLEVARSAVESELQELGLADVRRGTGLGPAHSRMRAEWSGISLR